MADDKPVGTALILSPTVPRERLDDVQQRLDEAIRNQAESLDYAEKHFDTIASAWCEATKAAPVEMQRKMARKALAMAADDVTWERRRHGNGSHYDHNQLNDDSQRMLDELLDAIVESHPDPVELIGAALCLWAQERY